VFPIGDAVRTSVRPYVTMLLIAANVAIFFFWQPATGSADEVAFLYEHAAIGCEIITGEPLTLSEIQAERCVSDTTSQQPVFPSKSIVASVLVSMFLHGNLLHLLGNMWFLWIFGNNVEEAFGHIAYLAMYLGAGIVATLGFVALNTGDTTPLIGASGAIAGVLGAYAVLFPRHPVIALLFFTLLPVPAGLFLLFWFLAQFAVAEPGVAWEAHVVGFLAGALVAFVLRGVLLERVRAASRRGRRFSL